MTIIQLSGSSATALGSREAEGLIAPLGRKLRRRRVSHIWPAGRAKRWAFRILRRVFGEDGRVAQWTREWKCVWTVRWANNSDRIVFASVSRQQCLQWEEERVCL